MANRTVTVKSSGGDYTSLNAAFAGEDDTYADLVTNTMILTFDCYNFEDTTVANTGTSWTTSSSYYLNVVAHDSHGGSFGTSAYRLSVSSTSPCLENSESNTKIDGLQCYAKGTGNYFNNVILSSESSTIINCILRGTDAPSRTAGSVPILKINYITKTYNVWNLIIYDSTASAGGLEPFGIKCNYGTASIYNVTIVNCSTGFKCDNTSITLKNCLTIDCTDGFSGSVNAASNYNASDVSSDAPGANSVDLSAYADTDIFSDPANDNFHLKSGSPCINVGTDLSGTFTTDIDGQTRSGTWDIGADEYVAAGPTMPIFLYHYMHH